jgi:hypothetical protein
MTICSCDKPPFQYLEYDTESLGYDSDFGEVSVDTCKKCNKQWLKYLIEEEHYSKSGRWWRIPIKNINNKKLTVKDAKSFIESAEWCFIGGSYYEGKISKITAPIKIR